MIDTRPSERSRRPSRFAGSWRWRLLVLALGCVAVANSASGSVDIELAYHEGVVAYGQDRLDDARALFEEVLAAEPNDVSTIQYLAIIAERQGRSEESIALFRRAVALAPEEMEIRFALSVALLRASKAAEAQVELEKILAVDSDNSKAVLYLGICRYRLQDYPGTIALMERAVELDPRLRQEARYYTGLAHVFTGDIDASTSAFGDAAAASPSNPLGQSAQRLQNQIRPFGRRWAVQAILGVEYDSNPLLVGVAPLSINGQQLQQDSDAVGVVNVNGRYDILQSEPFDWRIGYNGYFNFHADAKIVDQQTHVVFTNMGYDWRNLRFGLRYDYANTDLDRDDPFRDLHRLSPTINIDLLEWGITQLVYQYQHFDFKFNNPPPITVGGEQLDIDPTGNMHTVGANQYMYFSGVFTYGRIGLAYETTDTDGTEFDYDAIEANGGFGMLLPYDTRLDFLYRYIRRDFDNRSYFVPNIARDTNVHRVSLDISVPIRTYWQVSLRWASNFNDSNHPVYDYNRHIVGTYVSFTY